MTKINFVDLSEKQWDITNVFLASLLELQLQFIIIRWLSISLTHLHDLVSLFHPLLIGGAVWLDSTDKYSDVISSHEPQPNATLLHKWHCLKVWAVPESI